MYSLSKNKQILPVCKCQSKFSNHLQHSQAYFTIFPNLMTRYLRNTIDHIKPYCGRQLNKLHTNKKISHPETYHFLALLTHGLFARWTNNFLISGQFSINDKATATVGLPKKVHS